MKKFLVLISVLLVSAFIFAELTDVPENHWAYESVRKLEEAGIVTGYPDGTFRGASNVTRYELAVFLTRLMDLLENEINTVAVTLDVHENDIASLYNITGQLKKDVASVEENLTALSKRLDVHDKDIVRIYENLSQKVSKEEVEALNEQINFLFKKITITEENLKKYVDEKNNELVGKVLNIETNVNDAVPMLRNLVYQNAEGIKNLESKMIKYINVKMKSVDTKLKPLSEVKEMAQFNTETLNGFAAKLGEVEYALRKQIEETNKKVDANTTEIEALKATAEETKASVEEVKATAATKEELDAVSKKANSANTMSILSLVAGLVGLGLAVYAAFMKP